MSRRVEFSAWWDADINLRTARYVELAGAEIAERFIRAVETTVRLLADHPQLGRQPFPNDSEVGQFHSWLVQRPFHKHVIFYRFTDEALLLGRLIHGARDLPRRLSEPPEAE